MKVLLVLSLVAVVASPHGTLGGGVGYYGRRLGGVGLGGVGLGGVGLGGVGLGGVGLGGVGLGGGGLGGVGLGGGGLGGVGLGGVGLGGVGYYGRRLGGIGLGGVGLGGVGLGGVGLGGVGVQGIGSALQYSYQGALVDLSSQYSDYHFSWRHDGGKEYPWEQAIYYCTSLGPGWQGVSIETIFESKIINNVIAYDKLRYIWTGGYRSNYGWTWPSGKPFIGLNWSLTGLTGLPQPDNREDYNERCLAVLNYFYNDGITWHDIGCHHEKAIICERPRVYGYH
ncbi:uncharacterized protein [Procambarus clarkii]|uniref:uncharacterized protein n=1 Tax=Procambarus clarkii TaxID=6728 RepID=UPI003742AB26